MTTRFYIYRKNHVEGRKPLNVTWAADAAQAVAAFRLNEASHGGVGVPDAATGEFVAERKARPVHFWLY